MPKTCDGSANNQKFNRKESYQTSLIIFTQFYFIFKSQFIHYTEGRVYQLQD
jgi:hypothetical protein